MLIVIAKRFSPETVPWNKDNEYLNEEDPTANIFVSPIYFVVKGSEIPYIILSENAYCNIISPYHLT